MQQTKEIKVVLLGDSGVGKSSLLMRFVDNEFLEKGQPTLGAAFQSKTMMIDEKPLKFQIWDTAGQEKYKAILPLYYRGNASQNVDAKVAILVYDINEKQSFEGIKEWTKQLSESGPIDQIRAIVANKSDLECLINSNIAQDYATNTNALFFQTSCKDNVGIQETFYKIGQKIFEQSGNEENKKSQAENQCSTLKISSSQNDNKQKQQRGFCC